MTASALALQKSIFATLSAHAPLVAQLGGSRIHDDVPQTEEFPYVSFGQSTVRDADTGTEPGDEHIFTLHVWSRAKGRREAYAIIDTLRAALHDEHFSLDGHRLVNLRHEFSEVRRTPDGETLHGITRYRAVTEPL
jgi:hypothetical protein